MDKRDKKWWTFPRWSDEYENGVDEYIENTFVSKSRGDEICCPCEICHYRYWYRRNEIKDHIICNGFVPRYDMVSVENNDNEQENVMVDGDAYLNMNDNIEGLLKDTFNEGPNEDAKKFFKLVEEGQQELYKGCKKWVLQAINNAWRIHKCRTKQKHFNAYETDEERRKNRPKTMLETDFEDLLQYWQLKETKDESDTNKKNRQKLEDMHTMGHGLYARLRHKLIQEDPSNEQPSKAKVYKESRKRKCDKTYKTSFVKTKDNIEKMEVEGENTKDPYDIVINKPEHSGRVRLFGKGVTMTDLKKKGTQPAYKIPEDILRTIQSDLQSDLLQQLHEANPNLVIPEHLATSVRRAATSHTDSSHVNEPTGDQNNEYNDAGTSRSRLLN